MAAPLICIPCHCYRPEGAAEPVAGDVLASRSALAALFGPGIEGWRLLIPPVSIGPKMPGVG